MPLKQKMTMWYEALSYRLPLPVIRVVELESGDRYPVCPRCGQSFDREYIHYCDRCGQKLSWELFVFAAVQKTGVL